MKNYDIYGIGAALVDIELEVDDTFLNSHKIEKGEMTLVEPENQAQVLAAISSNQIKTKQASGGSAANSIFAAASFGATCYHSCKTNEDDAGKFFVNDMKLAGVDCTPNLSSQALPTGTCLVMITPDAERTMNTYLAISETISENELNEQAIQHSKYYYMEGYLSTSDSGRHAAIKGREIAEINQCKTALTFSDPAMVKFFKDQLAEMIGGGVDLLFCNEEEAMTWADTDNLTTALEKLKEICKSYAVTLGAKGAIVFDGKESFEIPAHSIKAVDTNGAGDMFAGAFLYAINKGHDFNKAGELASAAAAKVVADFGPRLAIDDHKALLSILD